MGEMTLKDKITIIILSRNEEKTIEKIIAKCRKYSDEVIVIDGHSEDSTPRIAEAMGVKVYPDNKKGKGDAIRVGITKASKDIIVFIDSDGSHDPDEIPSLVQPIIEDKADRQP